jgi:hypothetical protein
MGFKVLQGDYSHLAIPVDCLPQLMFSIAFTELYIPGGVPAYGAVLALIPSTLD